MSKILITGATGHLGTATVEYLLQKTAAYNIVALARDENKAKDLISSGIEVRYGNYNDIVSLDKAVLGIEKILLISTIDHHRYQQHKNVVDAAIKAGVKHIAYTSAAIKDVNASPVKSHLESHFQTEDYIKDSGLNYTIFRNTLYADVIPMYAGKKVFDKGIYLPAGNGKVAYALRREMAEGIANTLLQSAQTNKIFQITGSQLYSYDDIAQVLSEISGKTVSYTNADPTIFTEKLKQIGLPDRMIFIASGFSSDIKNQQYEILTKDLDSLLGRKPATLKEALKVIYSL